MNVLLYPPVLVFVILVSLLALTAVAAFIRSSVGGVKTTIPEPLPKQRSVGPCQCPICLHGDDDDDEDDDSSRGDDSLLGLGLGL